MSYVCIGVPYWIGEKQAKPAVNAIKRTGIAEELNAQWIDVVPDYAQYDNPVVAVNVAQSEAIKANVEHTPLIFAGDCVSALGALKGLERKSPAVLWYDAHGDFNTPQTTPSGFLGGMPLAAIVGMGNEILMQGIGLSPIRETDVIITDARDLDPKEGENLRKSQVTHLQNTSDLLIASLPNKPLYVHMDVDVVNSETMPAMNYPTSGGPNTEQVVETVHRIIRDADVVGVLFSLWNDELDDADIALENTMKIVRAFVQKD